MSQLDSGLKIWVRVVSQILRKKTWEFLFIVYCQKQRMCYAPLRSIELIHVTKKLGLWSFKTFWVSSVKVHIFWEGHNFFWEISTVDLFYVLLGAYYTDWSYYTYCLIFFWLIFTYTYRTMAFLYFLLGEKIEKLKIFPWFSNIRTVRSQKSGL
jgi:hypothetical protein